MPGLWLHALELFLVSVAIESPVPAPYLLDSMVGSCAEVLGAGECRPAAEAQKPEVLAEVAWDATWLTADVTLSAHGRPLGARRVVRFAEVDPLSERFRAIGLVIASTMLAELGRTAPVARSGEQPSGDGPSQVAPSEKASGDARASEDGRSPSASPPSPSERQRTSLPRALDLLALAGSALDRGLPRFGLGARGWLRLGELPLSLLLRADGAYRPDQPRILWGSFSGGMAVHLVPRGRRLDAHLRASFVGQRTQVHASHAQAAAPNRTGTFRYGPQLGAELALRLGTRMSLFAGGELTVLWPSVRIRLNGESVGAESLLSWAGLFGARWSWQRAKLPAPEARAR